MPFCGSRCRLEYNIKMALKDIGHEGMDSKWAVGTLGVVNGGEYNQLSKYSNQKSDLFHGTQ
jgi:hypothetical protein